jgi:lysophospholipase L1-like esterase
LNPLARNMVSFRILADDNFPEINCDPSAYPQGDPRRGIHLLDTAEQAIVRQRINEYNEAIRQRAEANGWIFVNPTAVLAPYLMDGPPFNYVRKCQMLATATTPLEMQQAVVQSCPVPPNMGGAPNLFGSLISFDGVHPSALAHRVIANALITAINTKHTLQIPLLP